MSNDASTATANGNTAGAESGSEVKTAAAASANTEAQATEQAATPAANAADEAKQQATTTDSLLAGDGDDADAKKTEGEESKTEGDKKEDDGDEDKKAEEVTPESYGEFEIPDGMPVNQPMLDDFKQIAAQNKMSKETAQALVSLKVKEVQDQIAAYQDQRKAWVSELKADPDFGGRAFDANVKTASMALRQFDQDGAALKVLQSTGLDNNPAIVKLLHRVGASVADDKIHTAKSAASMAEKPLGEALFGDMFEKKP